LLTSYISWTASWSARSNQKLPRRRCRHCHLNRQPHQQHRQAQPCHLMRQPLHTPAWDTMKAGNRSSHTAIKSTNRLPRRPVPQPCLNRPCRPSSHIRARAARTHARTHAFAHTQPHTRTSTRHRSALRSASVAPIHQCTWQRASRESKPITAKRIHGKASTRWSSCRTAGAASWASISSLI